MNGQAPEPGPQHGLLAAVIPADARRFRVKDPFLAEVLREAGAAIVEDFPDVEIADNDGEALGDARLTVVQLSAGRSVGVLPARVAKRLARSFGVRVSAGAIERRLRRRGFAHTSVLLWDLAQPMRLPDGTFGRRRRIVEYVPRNGLVTAAKARPESTVLDAVVAKASAAAGRSLTIGGVSVMGSGLIVDVVDGILRIGIGSGSRQLRAQFETLSRLRAAQPPPTVADRLPKMIAVGRSGLAEWSLETKLPGRPPSSPLAPNLLAEAIGFLVALHRVPGARAELPILGDQADTIAQACSPELVEALREVMASLEAALAEIPRGFAHGDFFHANLLAADDRLLGVIDWDAGGPGRLPLVDLLHLRYNESKRAAAEDWGPYVIETLLPLARAGGDELIRSYCAQRELEPEPRQLLALSAAYWLGYASYQLKMHPHRQHQRAWLALHVDGVLNELVRSGIC